MDSRATRSLALMSIHPRHVEMILSGRKRVEFRKVSFSGPLAYVVMYATAPVKRVVGIFSVKAIDEGSPSQLWRRYRTIGGVDHTVFRAYYAGSRRGVAIRVGRVVKLASPLRLSRLVARSPAPQSFRYLRERVVSRLGAASD